MAAEDASFNTVRLSISAGSIVFILPGTPSTITNGLAAFTEFLPRTVIEPVWLPGRPELWIAVTPGICPANAADTLDTGLDSNVSALIEDTEPVKLTFFCTP